MTENALIPVAYNTLPKVALSLAAMELDEQYYWLDEHGLNEPEIVWVNDLRNGIGNEEEDWEFNSGISGVLYGPISGNTYSPSREEVPLRSYDIVEILRSDNPYHDVGDREVVWRVDLDKKTLVCPDASGGAVYYDVEDVKLVHRPGENESAPVIIDLVDVIRQRAKDKKPVFVILPELHTSPEVSRLLEQLRQCVDSETVIKTINVEGSVDASCIEVKQ